MSESYVTAETALAPRPEPAETKAQESARFTPLRSAIVGRNYAPLDGTAEALSPLVPVRRRIT